MTIRSAEERARDKLYGGYRIMYGRFGTAACGRQFAYLDCGPDHHYVYWRDGIAITDGEPIEPILDQITACESEAEAILAKLGEIDRERLGDLVSGYDQRASIGFEPKLDGTGVWDGVTPQDCGGSNGSDHSYRLSKLVRLGLADHRKGTKWGQASTRHKGSKKYRPTALGRAVHRKGRTA